MSLPKGTFVEQPSLEMTTPSNKSTNNEKATTTTMPSDNASLHSSQVPYRPSFRDASVNGIAVVPLLCNYHRSTTTTTSDTDDSAATSSTNDSNDNIHHDRNSGSSGSLKSFDELFQSLRRYAHVRSAVSKGSGGSLAYAEEDSILLIVPNSNLTRPGDWRYDKTPLRNFHWGHGCQRMAIFDGRPHLSRRAHDRIQNPSTGRDWIDLCPWRRTAAVIGVLNMKDCPSVEHLRRAEEELNDWAHRFAVPSFENQRKDPSLSHVVAEEIVQRLFVFDSFDDECQKRVDLTKTKLGSNLVAFPPSDSEHTHMMDLHLIVVVNDLSVAIFRKLESKIRNADAITKGTAEGSSNPFSFFTRGPTGADGPLKYSSLSLKNITSVVSPENELASGTPTHSGDSQNFQNSFSMWTESANRTTSKPATRLASTASGGGGAEADPRLLTPLDDVWELSALSPKDADAMKRRNMARYEKWAADLCLLAGSPMDAYERHLHAAEACKIASDPLWYGSSLEGCAAAHIAMAEVGGYEMVDQYLENNFTLPDEFMANAIVTAQEKGRQTMQSKQVLPTVVFALIEEAVNIMSRHAKLAALQAELLLKMAWYSAELEERHLRCRWGEGEGSFLGDASENGVRWERCSVYDLKFQSELKTKDGEDLLLNNSLQRCRKWTQFLHRAVITGGLDPATRVDVAAACARMCLRGLTHTQWNNSSYPRLTCPRKAAYFTRLAAQTMSQLCSTEAASSEMGLLFQCNCLWLAACQLYSSKPNPSAHHGNYGWAVLRASTLHALSKQQDAIIAEAAAEALLAILSEIVPSQAIGNLNEPRIPLRGSEKVDDPSASGVSQGTSQDLDVSVRATTDPDAPASRKSRPKTTPARGGFFANSQTTASLLTVAQSKWADDDPISPLVLPLTEDQGMAFLNCVNAQVKSDNSAYAQRYCLGHISKLRMSMPTSSKGAVFAIYENSNNCHLPPPFRIVSAEIVKPASHMALERTKAHGFSGKAHLGAMATFFNPFDHEKKKAEKKIQATLVAEGEEQSVLVEFKNLLSVPLDIPSCQLDFSPRGHERIKAPAMSFIIPAKADRFAVHFPFIVLAADRAASTCEQKEESDDKPPSVDTADKFEVTGLKVTCCNRSFVIPVDPFDNGSASPPLTHAQIAQSAAIYPRLIPRKPSEDERRIKPRLEAVPAQPNLLVSFTTSQTPIDDNTTVPVHLSDGEIFTIPPFRLENDFGPSGVGTMQRLQISAVGLPGLPEEILYDTDTLAAAREKEDELDDDSEEDDEEEEEEKEDFEDMMVYDGLPPLKMKALCEGLDLKSINDKSKKRCDGSSVTFQIAATHDMGTQLANGGNVRIRFRYCGISPSPATEIWRKREIALRIVRVKGPRISSLTFRPDLTWGSGYSELCAALAMQKRERGVEAVLHGHDTGTGGKAGDKSFVLNRVGMDSGVHVSADHVVVLMAVANETNSTVILSNRKGLVGGFQASPMPTVRVTSGVSVKIPVVIPRISRVNPEEEDGIMDIASELVANTALQWETEVLHDPLDSEDGSASTKGGRRSIADAANRRVRQGRVRIPRRCLKEIIADFPSFAARICVPPCTVKISIGRDESASHVSVAPGAPVDTCVEMQLADWVPQDVMDKCSISLEFCCARKGVTKIEDLEGPSRRLEYMWCGRVQRTLRAEEETNNNATKEHRARICFLTCGHFVISACARISHHDRVGEEETWWAPVAENVIVDKPRF